MVARAVSRNGSAGRFAPPPKRDLMLAREAPVAKNDTIRKEKMEMTADTLTGTLLDAFGEIAQNEKCRAAIVAEVKNYLRLGKKSITDGDISALKARVTTILQGGGPTRSTMVAYKRAVADADEWSRLYAFIDAEHVAKDKARKELEAQKRKDVQQFQKQQLEEEETKHKQEAAEELGWAKHVDADIKKWQHDEAEKDARRLQATHKLKESVEAQLAERQEQKKLAAALKLQEERSSAADMAAELKAKMEAETAGIAKAKEELKLFLSANDVNKALKEEQRLQDQELDRKYARLYAERLDQEEKARLAQLAKRKEYQDRQAAIAQDLPESKRWIDPAIIERNFMAREAEDEAQEQDRKEKAQAAQARFRSELADQIKERSQVREKVKAETAAEDLAMEASYKAQLAKVEAEKTANAAKKEALRQQRVIQLEEAISRKLAVEAAMTKTEREINADTLRRMHATQALPQSTAPVA